MTNDTQPPSGDPAQFRLPSERSSPRPLVCLAITGCAPLVAQVLGSAFNIWYNIVDIQPLLTANQHAFFLHAINTYNLTFYPVLLALWIAVVLSLWPALDGLARGSSVPAEKLLSARRRLINLPWWAVAMAAPGWLFCAPMLLLTLARSPEPLNGNVSFHLSVSIAVSALIALTHSFFLVEIASQRLLFPIFFRDVTPMEISGTHPLTLTGRGLLWAVCTIVCPIVSLVLLLLVPEHHIARTQSFALAVGGIGIVYGLGSVLLLAFLVVEPISRLRDASHRVASGDFDARVELSRADEFGLLIQEFNAMIFELGEKQRVVQLFGRHVGEKTAQRLLSRGSSFGGEEKQITVMFADIRDFTKRCAACSPQAAVALLNTFLTAMLEVVERHGGIVNKFLGDGFMAMFGAVEEKPTHAADAVAAAREMVQRLRESNVRANPGEVLRIGIGLHTGAAVVGSIGSPHRMEYTAIGDTVNVASRVESLTKALGCEVLVTAETVKASGKPAQFTELPAQPVKGKAEPLLVFTLREECG